MGPHFRILRLRYCEGCSLRTHHISLIIESESASMELNMENLEFAQLRTLLELRRTQETEDDGRRHRILRLLQMLLVSLYNTSKHLSPGRSSRREGDVMYLYGMTQDKLEFGSQS